jgi:protein disulfide-isomerase A6
LNKNKPLDYQGERTAEGIVRYVLDKAREIANYRLSGKDSKKSSQSESKSQENKQQQKPVTDKDVIVLEDSNFDDIILKSNDMWLIEFYAPWCGHCKKLEPEWNQAASELKGKVKLAKVDATVHQQLSNRFGVRGYPTIKIFPPGPKTASSAESYDGPREASGIVSSALEKLEKYGFVPDPEQLTNEAQFKEICKDRTGVCIISLLPHIIDSSAKHRKNYFEEIKEASKISRGKPIYYLWAQGADFFDMEEKLHMSAGYPAVVAINFGKKKYSVCRSAFGAENIKTFVNSIFCS